MSNWRRLASVVLFTGSFAACAACSVGESEQGGPLDHLQREGDGSAAVAFGRDQGAGEEIVTSQTYSVACTTDEPATITAVEADVSGDVRLWLGDFDRDRGDVPGSYLGELPELDEAYAPKPATPVGRDWRDAVGETVDAPCRPGDLDGIHTRATVFGTLATIGPDGGRVREIRVTYTAGGRDWFVVLSDPQVIRRGPACRGACGRL